MENEESVFDAWSSSSEEFEHEALLEPTKLAAVKLDADISETEIKSFFSNIAEPGVDIYETRDENDCVVGSVAVMTFSSLEQTQALLYISVLMLAMKLKGEKMRGKPVYLTRWSSSLFTACVVGFDPTLSDNDLKQRFSEALGSIGTADKPESVGILIKTFIPRSTSNGASLGMPFEKVIGHGLLIAAGTVEDGLQVLEFQDSFGLEHGAQGFIKLAFFKYLLKEVYEF
ncbi:predicted protein [Arabidopsis lyrata subsp. lyrata]|uniref:Predicted protein n=1 Tax=Arabidopsis lyrata subsp. lyrata TaxID=81972 RepID=D7MMS7_ARALL|nr:predicted protein [Arabidopsis lyrata subsp. lyrata]